MPFSSSVDLQNTVLQKVCQNILATIERERERERDYDCMMLPVYYVCMSVRASRGCVMSV